MTEVGWQGEPRSAFDLVARGARRALLELVVAVGTRDDYGIAISAARLRWALETATTLADRHLRGDLFASSALETLRDRAEKWLGREARALTVEEIHRFIDRIRRASASQLVATASVIEGLDLDDLDLAKLSARKAHLTDVSARRAELTSLDATSAELRGCRFFDSDLSAAVFDEACVEDCDFSRSRLHRSSWRRAVVANVTFIGATLECAKLEGAVFSGCDFRAALLGAPAGSLKSEIRGARFESCDLRETSWRDCRLVDVVFTDCKMFGVHGLPQIESLTIERPDLSAAGDGSQHATSADVITGWGTLAGPGARVVTPSVPAVKTWRRR